MLTGLTVVLPFVEEWVVDDGVRSLEEPGQYSKELLATLDELDIPCYEVREEMKDLRERVRYVKDIAGH